jgi:pseudaminic acid cytidylyltransferase
MKNALKTTIFDDVVVSTESLEIAEIAEIPIKYRASVPYLRDSSISDDFTSSGNVVVDVIEYFERTSTPPEFIACIYPNSSCLESKDLQESLEKIKLERAEFLMAVRRIEFPIEITFVERAHGKLNFTDFKYFQRRSQDFPVRFLGAGQFYWGHLYWLERIVS